MVVKRYLEPILEPVFHQDSYGYRPGKSAHDALVVARRRCWDYDWVLDLDIKSFFDEIDWSLLMLAVQQHRGRIDLALGTDSSCRRDGPEARDLRSSGRGSSLACNREDRHTGGAVRGSI